MAPPDGGPISDSGRSLGTLVHACLEAYNTTGLWEEPLLEQESTFTEETHEDVVKQVALARTMVDGYLDWLSDGHEREFEQTLFVEHQMEYSLGTILGEEVVITGKVDEVLLDTRTGEHIVNDYKTVKDFRKDHEFWADDQLLTYALLLQRTEGLRPSVGRHTMLRKVGRSARAKPPFYDRADIYITPSMIEGHAANLAHTVTDMVRVSQALDHDPYTRAAYPNPTRDCGWDCDFVAACALFDDGADARKQIDYMLDTLYVRRSSANTQVTALQNP